MTSVWRGIGSRRHRGQSDGYVGWKGWKWEKFGVFIENGNLFGYMSYRIGHGINSKRLKTEIED